VKILVLKSMGCDKAQIIILIEYNKVSKEKKKRKEVSA